MGEIEKREARQSPSHLESILSFLFIILRRGWVEVLIPLDIKQF